MREAATARIKSMTSATSMATRLPTAVLIVSLISLIVATIVGVQTGTDLGRDLTDDRLVALRSSAASDIASKFNSLQRTSAALAASPQAVAALESFDEAHEELSSASIDSILEETESVANQYREQYIEPLEATGRDLNLRDIVSVSPAALYLQFHYAVDLGVVEDPTTISDARDGSTWSEVHAVVHPIYRDVVDRLDLVDLYLIEPDDATIVYSVAKRPDLGTSLDVGPLSGSFLAALVDRVRDDPAAGPVLADLSFYDPLLLSPVGAIASPILDGDRLVGVLVLMYDSAGITSTLTADGDWDAGGFPPTGESFLVGGDGLMRSDPRTYIEDPEAHLASSIEAGELDGDQAAFIELAGTTVLTQGAVDETVDAGIEGDDGVHKRPSSVGGEVFSTSEAVPLDTVDWYVATEVDVDVAEGDLDEFVDLLVVGTAIFLVSLAFLAVAWAARIVRPVRAISERLGARGRDLGPIDFPPRSPIEFRRLAASFESMSEALDDQQSQLAAAREERLDLLRRMLPPAVADRVASGDIESLEEVPQATVAVVVVLGLGTLVRSSEGEAGRELVDELHGELDELAKSHGLERVKVVGDAYFAACGHARPYIDHAPRVANFALAARDAVRELGADTPGGLDVSVGLHTGSVTVGVTAATRLLYDVWGEPVTAAHHLARRADSGQILVSEETRVLLPDTAETAPFDTDGGTTAWVVSGMTVRGLA